MSYLSSFISWFFFSHRNQLTAPDLVSATTPNVPRGLGGRGGGNEIVASGGLPYRPPSVDPYSEPMMPERYMTANRQHLPNQQIPPSQQQQQQPRPQQGSLSTLLSLNQHHRTSSPLGKLYRCAVRVLVFSRCFATL